MLRNLYSNISTTLSTSGVQCSIFISILSNTSINTEPSKEQGQKNIFKNDFSHKIMVYIGAKYIFKNYFPHKTVVNWCRIYFLKLFSTQNSWEHGQNIFLKIVSPTKQWGTWAKYIFINLWTQINHCFVWKIMFKNIFCPCHQMFCKENNFQKYILPMSPTVLWGK